MSTYKLIPPKDFSSAVIDGITYLPEKDGSVLVLSTLHRDVLVKSHKFKPHATTPLIDEKAAVEEPEEDEFDAMTKVDLKEYIEERGEELPKGKITRDELLTLARAAKAAGKKED